MSPIEDKLFKLQTGLGSLITPPHPPPLFKSKEKGDDFNQTGALRQCEI